jgi:hypothetical protein
MCLAGAPPLAVAVLGACAALLALAEPLWLPGAALAVVVVVLVCAERARRPEALAAGAVAIAVCLIPHLASTASQNDGRMFANVVARVDAEHPRDTPVQLLGDALIGGQRSIAALDRPDAGRSGRIALPALALVLLGAAYVLLVARLRLLVLMVALVALPALVVSARSPLDPAAAGAALWPALFVSGAILLYALSRATGVHDRVNAWRSRSLDAARARRSGARAGG